MRLTTRLFATLLASIVLAACGGDATSPPDDTPGPGDGPGPVQPPPAGQRGSIAYTRGNNEIRLIEPDGSNDRLLWRLPDNIDPTEAGILGGMAWRPDGGELAFSSGHEGVYSVFDRDIYAIRPDGSGLRRLTNPPAHAELARFPTGTVELEVVNPTDNFGVDGASGPFFVYVMGAKDPQIITLSPGESETLTFHEVADFGDMDQVAVAINPPYRWVAPLVDVRANEGVAGKFELHGRQDHLGAYVPAWHSDGRRVGYLLACATLNQSRYDLPPGGSSFTPLGNLQGTGACSWHWGPAAAPDQIVYGGGRTDRGSIYRMSESGDDRVRLASFGSEMVQAVQWLPDASGVLFSKTDEFHSSTNLFHYDFDSGAVTQLTGLDREFVRGFSVSPDGRSVVYERSDKLEDAVFEPPAVTQLWVMALDGSDPLMIVENGRSPAW